MGEKIGDGVHQTEDGSRIFISPDVQRYEREDGGEVVIVEPADPEDE